MREIQMVLNYSEATCDLKVDSNGMYLFPQRVGRWLVLKILVLNNYVVNVIMFSQCLLGAIEQRLVEQLPGPPRKPNTNYSLGLIKRVESNVLNQICSSRYVFQAPIAGIM